MSDTAEENTRLCIRLITPHGVYHSVDTLTHDEAEDMRKTMEQMMTAASRGQLNNMFFHNMVSPRGERVQVVMTQQVAQQCMVEMFIPATDEDIKL